MPFAKHDKRKQGANHSGKPVNNSGKQRVGMKGCQTSEQFVNQHSYQRETCQVCSLCNTLPSSQLNLVEEAFLKGKSYQAISEMCDLDPQEVDTHIHRCLRTRYDSRYARVSHAFDMLWQAIDVAHKTYMADPSMYHGTSYQGLLKQLRALMVDLENVQNSEELGADVTQYALNPMITALTNAVISESGSLKEDLTAKFDEVEAERLVGDFVRRLAKHFTLASQTAHERILDTLSARDKNRMKASGGPGRPKKPRGKHGNLRAVS